MRYSKTRALAVLSLLSTAACVQPAANVEMKGHYVYSKNGQQDYQDQQTSYAAPRLSASRSSQTTYAQPSHTDNNTQQVARIDSIGVSDLAPPQKDSLWASKTSDANEGVATGKTQVESSASQWKADSRTIATNELKPLTEQKKGSEVKLITEPKESAFIWPVNGNKILSAYGPKGSGKANDGINIAASQGEPVWAVADGEVIFVGDELSGYGNMVLVKHADSYSTTYAHLNQATVEKYDRVKQGDIIGYVGSTGNVKDPQLYFAVREGKQNLDPQKFLSRSMAGL
ncbi:MAG: M23 family metallopeptidase [Alphaproteobacteria bacterium]